MAGAPPALAQGRACYLGHQSSEQKNYKGKRPDLKYDYCNSLGHTMDRCWSLHLEMKPKVTKDKKAGNKKPATNYRVNMATHTVESFSSNPITLLNDLVSYLQERHCQRSVQEGVVNQGRDESTAPTTLLKKFAGFLIDANSKNSQGILTAFMTTLEINSLHDLWVVDSGATDNMSNKLTNIHDFCPISSFVSVANGKGVPVKGKGKIKLFSNTIESMSFTFLSFRFNCFLFKNWHPLLIVKLYLLLTRLSFRTPSTRRRLVKDFI